MTTIKYQPTTLQSFGAPGTLFSGAAESLQKATSGAIDSLDAYRKGLEDEQARRAKIALGDIEAAQSQADYDVIAAQLSNPEQIKQIYGLKDPSEIVKALRQQQFDVRDLEQKEYEYQQALRNRQESPVVNRFISSFGTQRYKDLNRSNFTNSEEFNSLSSQGQQQVIAEFYKALKNASDRAETATDIAERRFDLQAKKNKLADAKYASSVINSVMVNKDGSVKTYTPELEKKIVAQLRSRDINPEPLIKSFRETEKWKADLNKEDREWVKSILDLFPNETLFEIPFLGLGVGDSDQSNASRDLAKLMDAGISRKVIEQLFRMSREDGVDYNPKRIKNFLDEVGSNADAKDVAKALNKSLEEAVNENGPRPNENTLLDGTLRNNPLFIN